MNNKKKKTYIDVKFKAIFVASTFAMLIEYLMSLTDKILSGNILGTDALAAITLVEPFTLIVAFLACVFSGITGAPVASALGKGNKKKADQYISQSVILAIIVGTVISVIYIVFSDKLLLAVAGNSPALPYVMEYFKYLKFIPVPMLLNGVLYLAVLYRGGEKYCNVSAGVSVISNIGLSIILCFNMGMEGIGLGSIVGSVVGLVPLIIFMFTEKGKIHFYFRLSFNDLKETIIYSVADSLTYLYLAVFQMGMNTFLINQYDKKAIIVFTGVVNVMGLVSAMSDGLVEFLVPMLKSYRGEGNVLGCRNTFKKALKASIVEGLILTVVLIIFAKAMAIVFGVEDATVGNDFAVAVRIYAVTIVLYYLVDLYSQYYLYIEEFKLSFVTGLFKGLIIPLIMGVGCGLLFGINGVWIGISASQIIMLVGAYIIIRKNPKAGKDGMFLERDKLDYQWMWNISMNKKEIMGLIDQVCQVLKSKDIEQKRINKAALLIEESQIASLKKDNKLEKYILECSLLLGKNSDHITLILRNTAPGSNVFENKSEDNIVKQASLDIINNMEVVGKSYILVNGNNRLIFEL